MLGRCPPGNWLVAAEVCANWRHWQHLNLVLHFVCELSALPGKVESPCRKGIAPNQYVGANPCRRSHATSPGFALGFAVFAFSRGIWAMGEGECCRDVRRGFRDDGVSNACAGTQAFKDHTFSKSGPRCQEIAAHRPAAPAAIRLSAQTSSKLNQLFFRNCSPRYL